MNPSTKPHPEEIPIQVDHRPYKAPKSMMTGLEIMALAAVDSVEYELWLDEPGHGDDTKVADGVPLELHPGMHFYSMLRKLNPGAA